MGNGTCQHLGGRPPEAHQVKAASGQPGELVAGPLLGVAAHRGHGSTVRAGCGAGNTTFLEWAALLLGPRVDVDRATAREEQWTPTSKSAPACGCLVPPTGRSRGRRSPGPYG